MVQIKTIVVDYSLLRRGYQKAGRAGQKGRRGPRQGIPRRRHSFQLRRVEATSFADKCNKQRIRSNFSYVHQGSIFDCDEAAFDRSYDINVKSMFFTNKAFLPGVRRGKDDSLCVRMGNCLRTFKTSGNIWTRE